MQPTRTPHRVLTVALTSIIVALPVTGCGKSTAKTTSAATPANTTTTQVTGPNAASSEPFKAPAVKIAKGTPLTHSQWVAKANTVCARYFPSINIHIKGFRELPRVLPQQAAFLRQEIQQLAKLTPPQSDRRDWQTLLNSLMRWAQGDVQVAQHPGPQLTVLGTPTGQALLKTSKQAIQLARQKHLTHCAGD